MKKRSCRAKGDGHVRRRTDGRWEVQLQIGQRPDGRRSVKSFYGKTQSEALQKARDYRDQHKSGSLPSNDKPVGFSTWADTWYAWMRDQVADSTYAGYAYTLSRLKAFFGDTPLTEIQSLQVDEFLHSEAEKGISKSYLDKERAMLHQIFHQAIGRRLVDPLNPVSYAGHVKDLPEPEEKDFYRCNEVHALFCTLPNDKMGNSIRLLLMTGLRLGEFLALRAEHIEADGSAIHVRQAAKLVNGKPIIGPPKNKSSSRDIPIPAACQQMVRQLREECAPYIWNSRNKNVPFDPSHWRRLYKETIADYVEKDRIFSPHILRHTYSSLLKEIKEDMMTIRSLMGHSKRNVTENYIHIRLEVKHKAVEKLADYCGLQNIE